MTQKIRVGVVFGGKSPEHEVSLLSAKNVIAALDKNKYEVVLIGIDKNGEWHLRDAERFLIHADNPKEIRMQTSKEHVVLIPQEEGKNLVGLNTPSLREPIDVIFPILHGAYGEDGTIQGLLKLAGIPFVGADVLGSALAMDKDVMKRLLKEAGIPIAKFITATRYSVHKLQFASVVEALGLPFFIKPANTGSSVGITKVKQECDWAQALEHAFQYDHKILIEEFMLGRELECSVLGNEDPIASLPGEVIPHHEYYSYEAKYLDDGASFRTPAELDAASAQRIQEMAIAVYQVVCCEGMARVDFFMKESGELFVNEINTIPGFTKLSMYPRMWEASGLNYSDLLDRLIELSLERFKRDQTLKTIF